LAALGFDFAATTVVAPNTAGDFTVTRPFTFSGRLLGADGIEQQLVFFDRFLVGQGLLTASFVSTPSPESRVIPT
jgi:hypothetical protein